MSLLNFEVKEDRCVVIVIVRRRYWWLQRGCSYIIIITTISPHHLWTTASVSADLSRLLYRVYKSSNKMACPLKEQYHFPFKLYSMLQYAADSEYSSAISWTEEGQAFAIHNKDTFLEHVVPMFFKQTKFISFVSLSFSFLSTYFVSCLRWFHSHTVLLPTIK